MRTSWFKVYRVSGSSMQPTFRAGETLVASGWLKPKVGRVAVIYRGGRLLIKRIIEIDQDRVWVEGDNQAASTDSRQFGYIRRNRIVAVVVWPYGRSKITKPVNTSAATQPAKTSRFS